MEKIHVDKNRRKYILFKIDVYFNKFLLAVEVDEKGHTDKDLIFEGKRQEALEKKLGCKFIRINKSSAKNGYDLDYEVDGMEAFIDEFKKKKIKELENKLIDRRKRSERETSKRNERESRKRTKRQK